MSAASLVGCLVDSVVSLSERGVDGLMDDDNAAHQLFAGVFTFRFSFFFVVAAPLSAQPARIGCSERREHVVTT
jgi:hypothetical protein